MSFENISTPLAEVRSVPARAGSGHPARLAVCPPRAVAVAVPRRIAMGLVVALLTTYAWLAWCFASSTSATFDEPGLIAAGYSYWEKPELGLRTANFRLSQLWHALPLLTIEPRPRLPAFTSGLITDAGRHFLTGEGNDSQEILRRARLAAIALGLFFGWVVYRWSRELHGEAAGLVSLAFFCLSPVMLSNGALATTDIATALMLTLVAWGWNRLACRPNWGAAWWAGLATGGAVSCKATGLLAAPLAVGVLVLHASLALRRSERRPGESRLAAGGRWLIARWRMASAAGVVAWAAIWAVYGLRFSAAPEMWLGWSDHELSWGRLALQAAHSVRLLPEAYLLDLDNVVNTTGLRSAFLLGEFSVNGWWYFFPVVGWLKSPWAFQVALAVVVGAVAVAHWRRGAIALDWRGLAPAAILFVGYGGVSIASPLNIGVRHILPLYPLLFLLAGALVRVRWLAGWRLAAAGAVLLGGSVASLARVHPQYLAYVNEFAGGPERGYRLLADSSYEWGQDLPALEEWLRQRAAQPGEKRPVFFSYFGNADLGAHKIDAVLLPQFFDARPVRGYALGPGTYVISSTMLTGLYTRAMGPWRPACEEQYQALLLDLRKLDALAGDPAAQQRLIRIDGEELWRRRVALHDQLRFARLCAALRRREPDARVSYGLLVYEVGEKELTEALYGLPLELDGHYRVKMPPGRRPEDIGLIP